MEQNQNERRRRVNSIFFLFLRCQRFSDIKNKLPAVSSSYLSHEYRNIEIINTFDEISRNVALCSKKSSVKSNIIRHEPFVHLDFPVRLESIDTALSASPEELLALASTTNLFFLGTPIIF